MNDKILSQDDLIEITGYRIPSKQMEVLKRHGITYIHRPDNTLCVLWKWVEDINASNKKREEERPKLMSDPARPKL
jgi:hypothetical protein